MQASQFVHGWVMARTPEILHARWCLNSGSGHLSHIILTMGNPLSWSSLALLIHAAYIKMMVMVHCTPVDCQGCMVCSKCSWPMSKDALCQHSCVQWHVASIYLWNGKWKDWKIEYIWIHKVTEQINCLGRLLKWHQQQLACHAHGRDWNSVGDCHGLLYSYSTCRVRSHN